MSDSKPFDLWDFLLTDGPKFQYLAQAEIHQTGAVFDSNND